jgi:hypothetical protein
VIGLVILALAFKEISNISQSPFHFGGAHIFDVADTESFAANFWSDVTLLIGLRKASSIGSFFH